MFKRYFIAALSALSLVFLTIPAHAGGGQLWLTVDGQASPDSASIRSVRFYIDPKLPCKGAEFTLKFEQSQDGDSITVGSPTMPYVMTADVDHWYVSEKNTWVPVCGSYAKVYSKKLGERTVDVTAKTTDGKEMSGKIVVIFDGQNYGDKLDMDFPWIGDYVPSKNPPPSPSIIPTPAVRPYGAGPMNYTPNPSAHATASAVSDSSKEAELNQKIDNLQQRLNESEKKQNFLQQQLDNLRAWLRSVFPFFK